MEDLTDNSMFTINFTHSEQSFRSLAHMQYDLFCRRSQFLRLVIAITTIFIGVIYAGTWWSYLLIAYGTFTILGKYNRVNHTANKLVKTLEDEGLPFPSSIYVFTDNRIRVFSEIDGEELTPLYYKDVLTLAQDRENYFIFKNEAGGYIVPKEQLQDKKNEFAEFIQSKTGKIIVGKRTPALKVFLHEYKKRKNSPYHL